MADHDFLPRSVTPPWPARLALRLLRWYVSVPLILILAINGLLCGYRVYRLSLLPPPSLPPEVEALLRQPPTPDDQNAHVDLQRAATRLSRFRGDRQEIDETLVLGWHRASSDVRQHLSNNADALELFLAGTEKPEYLQFPVNELNTATSLPDVDLTDNMVLLVQLDIARRISEVDYSGAENELRQLLQFSVLVSRYGPRISHILGAGFQRRALSLLLKLVRDDRCPKTIVANLKQILIDIRREIPPVSQCLTVEYLSSLQAPIEVRSACWELPAWGNRDHTRVELFFRAEPEFSFRVHQHYLAMLLPDADVPRRLRTREMNDPFTRGSANTNDGVAGSQLTKAFLSGTGARLFHMREFLDTYDRRLAILDLAIIATALRHYRDDHGNFPTELHQLSPQYLSEVPINPRSPTGDAFSYRREESGCVVFWAGRDGIDESYLIDTDSMWAYGTGSDNEFGIRFGSIDCDTPGDF